MTKLIISLRRVDGTDWKEMFERVNAIEHVLRRDPCDAYASMDFESRDHYRKLISALAESSKATEQQVAEENRGTGAADSSVTGCPRAAAAIARRLLPRGRGPETT